MWRCARCGARNNRDVDHCGQCGMPSPFGDGGHTKTIDIPDVEPERPARRSSPSGVAILVGVVAVVVILLVVVVAVSG